MPRYTPQTTRTNRTRSSMSADFPCHGPLQRPERSGRRGAAYRSGPRWSLPPCVLREWRDATTPSCIEQGQRRSHPAESRPVQRRLATRWPPSVRTKRPARPSALLLVCRDRCSHARSCRGRISARGPERAREIAIAQRVSHIRPSVPLARSDHTSGRVVTALRRTHMAVACFLVDDR